MKGTTKKHVKIKFYSEERGAVMTSKLNIFLNEHFPKLSLTPGLFYEWSPALRFELGIDYSHELAYPNSPYLQQVYHRAKTLFSAVNDKEDDIFLVVDATGGKVFDKKKLPHKHQNLFFPYVRNREILKKLTLEKINLQEEERCFSRFILPCKVKEIRMHKLLEAICNQDMGIIPQYQLPVYVVNKTKQTIFYAYDDQGCDILAAKTSKITHVYEQFNAWILDYDRKQIDSVFKR